MSRHSLGSLLAELQPLYGGGETLLGRLAGVSLAALGVALGFHVLKLAARARAWQNIVRAAYPDDSPRFREVLAAFLAGLGVDAVVPARPGTFLRLGLLRQRLPSSTLAGLASTLLAESVFNVLLTVVLVGAAIGFGFGLSGGALLPGFIGGHAVVVALVAGAVGIGLTFLAVRFRARLRSTLAEAGRGLAVFSNPAEYARRVVCWQALAWGLRVGSVYWFLVAFHLPATLLTALLVVVVQLVASAVPLTPGGAGPQQMMLVVALSASAAGTVLGFGIGMQAATALADVVLGAGALLHLTGSLHWRRSGTLRVATAALDRAS